MQITINSLEKNVTDVKPGKETPVKIIFVSIIFGVDDKWYIVSLDSGRYDEQTYYNNKINLLLYGRNKVSYWVPGAGH